MPTLIVARLMSPHPPLEVELEQLSATPNGSPWELSLPVFVCQKPIDRRLLELVLNDQSIAFFLRSLRRYPLAVLGPTTTRSATDGCILRAMPVWESLRKLLGQNLRAKLHRDRALTAVPMPRLLYGPLPDMSRKRLCLDKLELRVIPEG